MTSQLSILGSSIHTFIQSQSQNFIAFLLLASISISLIGFADAGYVTFEKMSGNVPACGQGFKCDSVLNSPWAYIGPIPVSAFGMLFYVTMFSLGLLHYLDVTIPDFIRTQAQRIFHIFPAQENITWQFFAFLISIAGFLFTLYLVSIMAFVLQAWCLFCIISAASSISLFIIHTKLIYIETYIKKIQT